MIGFFVFRTSRVSLEVMQRNHPSERNMNKIKNKNEVDKKECLREFLFWKIIKNI